jgi:hypothetical protein
MKLRLQLYEDEGNHLPGLLELLSWTIAMAAQTGTDAGRDKWRGVRHLSFRCRPLERHRPTMRSMVTVQWKNCHRSSVYGQSERKIVNKWINVWKFTRNSLNFLACCVTHHVLLLTFDLKKKEKERLHLLFVKFFFWETVANWASLNSFNKRNFHKN